MQVILWNKLNSLKVVFSAAFGTESFVAAPWLGDRAKNYCLQAPPPHVSPELCVVCELFVLAPRSNEKKKKKRNHHFRV